MKSGSSIGDASVRVFKFRQASRYSGSADASRSCQAACRLVGSRTTTGNLSVLAGNTGKNGRARTVGYSIVLMPRCAIFFRLQLREGSPNIVRVGEIVKKYKMNEGAGVVSVGKTPESPSISESPSAFPAPVVPVVPVLSGATLFSRRVSNLPDVRELPHVLYTSSGAAAIALALRHAGVREGEEVLLPAYHCLSMVEPVQAIGARPVFYPVRADLSVAEDDLATRIGPATRALLVTHFFGFLQDLDPIRVLADRHGLILIEDCAHAFLGRVRNRSVGTSGDYAIASARKFFPIFDGGCLASVRHEVGGLKMHSAGAMFQVKAGINILEEGFQFGRLRFFYLLLGWTLTLKDIIWRALKRPAGEGNETSTESTPRSGFQYFVPERTQAAMSIPSRIVMGLSGTRRIVERRRANYRRIVDGLSGLSNGRPLYENLPEGVAPYMVPYIVDWPEIVFPKLKNLGVPIYRWETLATDSCTISNDYSRRLLQLPCHQELRNSEMEWMIGCIRDTLSATSQADGKVATKVGSRGR